jgi:hypothetical protein
MGFVDGQPSDDHCPALTEELREAVVNLCRLASDICGSEFARESRSLCSESKRNKVAWVFGGGSKRAKDDATLLKDSVDKLHQLAPPDVVQGKTTLRTGHKPVDTLGPGLGTWNALEIITLIVNE